MNFANAPAPNTSYYTPAQVPPSGTALDPQPDGKPIPKLFQPLQIRGVEFHNRIFLSPLCQYSADYGALTAWHKAHLGGIFTRGPGLSFVEATAVTKKGRITPEDSGLWSDAQIAPLREIVEFAHSQGQKIGLQLSHAGRKASTVAPWLSKGATAASEHGGWPDNVWAPSAVPHDPEYPQPKELSIEGIKIIVGAWVDATKRALKAGFDVLEIHNAHGYLLHEFLSPVSNKRTDEYGGCFENRVRLTLEIVEAMRAVIPKEMPLFLRISATDWLEEAAPDTPSWTIEDTVKLSALLVAHGVDLLDVSSGGISPAQRAKPGPAYQAPFSAAFKHVQGADGLLVGAVGSITNGPLAEEVLQKGQADVIFVGRQFQKDPSSVWTFAEQLGVQIKVAHQIGWGFGMSGSGRGKSAGTQSRANIGTKVNAPIP